MVKLVTCEKVSLYTKSGASILDNISLEINKGEIVNIIGPNGGGKTTLLRVLLGVLSPSAGKVSVNEKSKIAYMPQKIVHNDLLPVDVMFFLTFGQKPLGFVQLTKKYKIEHLLDKQLKDLSGGELQKILFFRVIMQKADILFLDEPTQGLDVNGQERFFEHLTELNQKSGKTIIMVSHDLHTVMRSTNRVICLNKHICCTGQPDEVQKSKSYIDIFGKKHQYISHYSHEHNHEH